MTQQLRSATPNLHGAGDAYFGLAWSALEWLEDAVQPGMTTLETGTGASTIVFAARGSAHTAISPAAGEHDRIRSWCEQHGIATDRLRFIAEPSEAALTGAWEPEPLDLVLVDGAHLFPLPALDWFHTARHLRVGGRVVLDDAFLPSVHMVVRFLRLSPSWAFEGAISYRTVCFRKLDDAVLYAANATPFDSVPRFDYLPPAARAGAYARYLLVDRSPRAQRILRRVRR